MVPNVATALAERARTSPQANALIDARSQASISYAALWSRVSSVALAMRESGVDRGSVVGICAGNSIAQVATVFATLSCGATVLPISPRDGPGAAAEKLQLAGARLLLHPSDGRAALLAREVAARYPVCCDSGPWRASQHSSAGSPPPSTVDAHDVALLLFTSGTSGRARGVAIGHDALLRHTRALVEERLRLSERDVILGALPLSHSFGLRMVLLAACVSGASVVLTPHPSPAADVAACLQHGVTWLPAVPTMLYGMADAAEAPLPSLRWCLSAGAPLAEALRVRAEGRLGAPIYQGYGLTEASFCCVDAPPERPVAGSVGRPSPGVALEIVDPRTGREVAGGEPGEVRVRGANRMLGYLGESWPAERWLHTGDLGVRGADGRVRVVDRLKDLILRGGHNVVPAEVESALVALPQVAAASVVGVPDARLGEAVVAVIVTRDGQRADLGTIHSALHERLADWQRPARYAVVDALPHGGSGKVLRRALRSALVAGELVTRAP